MHPSSNNNQRNNYNHPEVGPGVYHYRGDFRGADLVGRDIRQSHFENVDLREAHLERAHLEGTSFLGNTYLQGVYLEGAHLEGAHLEGRHLEGAHLEGAHLEGAHLEGAFLQGANLTGAFLQGANLTGAHLEETDFYGVDLSEVIMDEEERRSIQLSIERRMQELREVQDRRNRTYAQRINRAYREEQDRYMRMWEQRLRMARVRELPPSQSLLPARNQSSARASSLNNDDALTISNYGNGIIINIPRKLRIEFTRDINNKSCPDFRPLYDQIMLIDLPENFRFKFKGETGVDASGLTKLVYDKLFPIYKKLYFVDALEEEQFILLKKDVKIDELTRDTNQIIKLAIAARSQIYLQILPQLVELLLSPNSIKNITERKNFNKLYANLRERISQINSENISNYLLKPKQVIKSADNINKLNKKIQSEMILRKQLLNFHFKSWEQYENMALFIKSFWKEHKLEYRNRGTQVEFPLFSCEFKYDIENFKKRLKIKHSHEILDLDKIPPNLFKLYPALSPLLEYILNKDLAANINRRKFVKYVAGTEYTLCQIYIYLYDTEIPIEKFNNESNKTKIYKLPFHPHTCDSALDLYKIPSSSNYLEKWTVERIDEEITKGSSGMAAHN
jgi:hypothetical protein